jgi:hypothetical protein
MNEKLLLNLVKSKSNPLKEITDEQKHIKRLAKEVYAEATNKKLQSNKRKKKTTAKNKKTCIVFNERRHKSPTIKKTSLYMIKSSIGDDSIMKRRVRDTLKRKF